MMACDFEPMNCRVYAYMYVWKIDLLMYTSLGLSGLPHIMESTTSIRNNAEVYMYMYTYFSASFAQLC
jgi:hypothetical protein